MQTNQIRTIIMFSVSSIILVIATYMPTVETGIAVSIVGLIAFAMTIHFFMNIMFDAYTSMSTEANQTESQKTIKLELLEGATQPFYAHKTDAGMDVYANEDITIAPGETKLIHTGLKMAIPEGYEIQVRPRSGLSLKTPLRICNAPGTIDSGYRDEVGIIMQNTSERFFTDGVGIVKVMPDIEKNHYTVDSKDNRKGWYDIKKGDRIAQIVLQKVPRIKWEEVNSVAEIKGDRGGGFGSTGTK